MNLIMQSSINAEQVVKWVRRSDVLFRKKRHFHSTGVKLDRWHAISSVYILRKSGSFITLLSLSVPHGLLAVQPHFLPAESEETPRTGIAAGEEARPGAHLDGQEVDRRGPVMLDPNGLLLPVHEELVQGEVAAGLGCWKMLFEFGMYVCSTKQRTAPSALIGRHKRPGLTKQP